MKVELLPSGECDVSWIKEDGSLGRERWSKEEIQQAKRVAKVCCESRHKQWPRGVCSCLACQASVAK